MNNYNDNYIGESEAFLNFQRQIAEAASVDRSVLVIGERGTGKEMAAKRLHYLSKRWEHKLITLNCAALAPSLLESELFGYEEGAFTGAKKTRKGRFEEAQEGTLFLDEIGNIPMQVQEKILRVVEYGTYERVGSSMTHEADVRIVGATNSNLPKLCEEGKFKEDLLDRLSFEVIYVPPLRVRGNDILLLANFFAAKMALECSKETPTFSFDVQQELLHYPWPGNVRELKNTVERAVYKTQGNVIKELHMNPFEDPYLGSLTKDENLNKTTFDFNNLPLTDLETIKNSLEDSFLNRAMTLSNNNQKEAARLMNISYDQFRGLYRKHKGKKAEK
ncbi:MAG: sigma 54-interacting transcriptional regulator [Sphaerochaetaceae bacterium]|nr:sigma 54-interacting transcriptional regulator [Sphaerochaetaceae bacterium]